jgi:hypothetical protein
MNVSTVIYIAAAGVLVIVLIGLGKDALKLLRKRDQDDGDK